MLRLSFDTEDTGVDFYHGAEPFLFTFCNEQWENEWYEWDVDPLTRKVQVVQEDLDQIVARINECDELVLQNAKFDMQAMARVSDFAWPQHKTKDTTISGHLCASNHLKNLTSMAIEYLGMDISKYEKAMQEAVVKVRNLVKRKDSPIGNWRIANEGLPEMPSAKADAKDKKEDNKPWKFDTWILRAFVKWCVAEGQQALLKDLSGADYDGDHPWLHLTARYANVDSSTTLGIHLQHMRIIEQKGLMKLYDERMKLVPIVAGMEQRGVTLNGARLRELRTEYIADSARANSVCVNIAAEYKYTDEEGNTGPYQLELPKGGVNNSLKKFVFDVMDLPRVSYTKTGPSMDKDVIDEWTKVLEPRSKPAIFVQNLSGKRKRDTAVTYMNGYERFWIPLNANDWFTIHPSLNLIGTGTLRGSSSNPNEQNISKKEGFNLRYIFGPAPGREWWSLDAKNIELRIPAYESGELEIISLFEEPDKPPYYGSTHLLNFHTIYEDLWDAELKAVGLEKVGPACKKKYASTWYQWCKNGGFAVQYGAIERANTVSTADRAFHRVGSHAKLKARFSKLEALNNKWIKHAEKYGYVTTLPDKHVDPDHGYPLICTRSDYGKIIPTVPLNYHVQGSAMWWTCRAMVRCQECLDQWAREGFYAFLCMQIHDELVFDFPAGRGSRPWLTNLPRVQELARLMALGGEGFGLPTPVGIEYHSKVWSEGVTLN